MESGMISVDRWASSSQAYFLTHLHSDHTKGLSPTWKRGPLFCSQITAKLLPFKFPGFDLSLLRVLDIGKWHSISLVSPSSNSQTFIQVMPIDAHHCPGAVMFLFRGEFGCMLYTGDFRWEETSERAQSGRTMLLNALKDERIDTLYLDNTYCNPSYSFPSREVAALQVVDVISSHPEHDIIIGIDSLGKEDLLIYISHMLNIKIWVWPERLQIMHLLGFHNIFTTKTALTRVRAVPRYSLSIDTLEALNMMRPTIGIMASGLPWATKFIGGTNNRFGNSSSISRNTKSQNRSVRSVERYHKHIYVVPYSDHSCFSEIEEFVKLLLPFKMKGIVSSSTAYVDPLYHLGHLCGANGSSMRLYPKLEGKDEGERDKATRTKGPLKRKRTTQVDCRGVRRSRVSILRRERHGAKIVEMDSAD